VVHGPSAEQYDVDLGPVFLTEWYHKDYLELADDVVGTNQTLWKPFADNNMINGKMNYDCSLVTDGTPCECNAGVSKFRFTQGKTHRLRLINGGAGALQHFSIDGHNMTVIANDFVPITPYSTNVVTLGIGQRTDILVEGTGNINGAYWMRSNVSDVCAFSYQPQALAAIYYDHADTNAMPNSTPWPKTSQYDDCANDPLNTTIPLYPIAADLIPTVTQEIEFNHITNATGHQVWTVNEIGFHADYNDPILELANKGNDSYPYNPEWNVYNMGTNHTVRIVMHNNSTTTTHPMHLHGHNMFVLTEGDGYWDGVTITNIQNPQRRDVQQLRPGGHLVIQYVQDNPGVWPLHCHIAWHLSTGFYLNLLERPEDVKQLKVPDSMQRTCKNWQAYTNVNIVDEIDSGV
jgi:FtsP/CotA-like multicopper oxidase with cupredoxin domain